MNTSMKWKAFTAIAISFVTLVMSMGMIFVALSAIAEDFDVTLRAVSWVVISQALVVSALMMPMGRLADLVGRRRVHLIGLALFGCAALFAAFSPSLGALIVARVVMAAGSAMSQSVGTAMIVAVFPDNERGNAIGSQTTAVAVGAALGPVIAGLILQFASWRLLFIVVAVPVFVAWVAGYLILDEAVVSAGRSEENPTFDWIGAILSALGVTVLVLTMNNPLALPWLSPPVIIGALVGVGALVGFFKWEMRCDAPMLQPRLFKNRFLTRAILTRLLGFMAFTAIRIVVPVFLISVRGFGEGTAGFVLFLTAVGLGIASQTFGRLADRLGERRFVVAGFSLFLLSLGGLVMLDTSTPMWIIAMLLFVNGAAQGVWSVPNNSMIMGSVPASDLGVTGALTNLTRNLANVMGQAMATAAIVGVMASRGFDIALSEINETPGAADAFLDGWRVAFVLVVVLATSALVLSLRREPVRPMRRSELPTPRSGDASGR